MSKNKNSGLDQYGAEPFEQQHFGTAGVEGVNPRMANVCRCTEQAYNTEINTKTLQFNKYCKGGPVKASKQQKSFWG